MEKQLEVVAQVKLRARKIKEGRQRRETEEANSKLEEKQANSKLEEKGANSKNNEAADKGSAEKNENIVSRRIRHSEQIGNRLDPNEKKKLIEEETDEKQEKLIEEETDEKQKKLI